MKNIRQVIRRTISSFGITVDDQVVDGLAAKASKARANNPESYAYIVARNWAVDQQRNREAAARTAKAAAEKAAKEAREQRVSEQAKKDLWPTAAAVSGKLELPDSSFLLLWLRAFEKLSDEEVAPLFPGTSREARYQRRCRARKAMLPNASPELTEVISRGMH